MTLKLLPSANGSLSISTATSALFQERRRRFSSCDQVAWFRSCRTPTQGSQGREPRPFSRGFIAPFPNTQVVSSFPSPFLPVFPIFLLPERASFDACATARAPLSYLHIIAPRTPFLGGLSPSNQQPTCNTRNTTPELTRIRQPTHLRWVTFGPINSLTPGLHPRLRVELGEFFFLTFTDQGPVKIVEVGHGFRMRGYSIWLLQVRSTSTNLPRTVPATMSTMVLACCVSIVVVSESSTRSGCWTSIPRSTSTIEGLYLLTP